jgi:hypothetical protein|nr:MAG TPA: Protein of unknown function (DUF1642) [Caudoviricetes sp.]
MNKKELIEKIESLPDNIGLIRPHIDKKLVLGLVRELDEPEQVTIPQFVADVIEGARKQSAELEDAFEYVWEVAIGELREWFRKLENRDTFARAWLDAYEIEGEKRYIIKLKGVPDGAKFLKYAKVTQEWYFGMKEFYSDREIIHTRKELEEAGFGWVFVCEGIEIEEVTE